LYQIVVPYLVIGRRHLGDMHGDTEEDTHGDAIRFASIILPSGHYYADPALPTPSMERIEA
jgi:hypothetical protein